MMYKLAVNKLMLVHCSVIDAFLIPKFTNIWMTNLVEQI